MKFVILTATATAALFATPATAQQYVPVQAPAASPIPAPSTANAVLRAGTPISLRFLEEVRSKKSEARVGQRIRMEVASNVEVNGVVVIPAGSPAEGELTRVKKKGMWGKSGRLEGRALFARVNGRQIRLSGAFDDKGTTGTAGVVASVAVLPVAGFFVTGTTAKFPMGAEVPAFIDEDVPLAMANVPQAPLQIGTPIAVENVALNESQD